MSLVQMIGNFAKLAAAAGGVTGFIAQWLIFQKGNFSETSGPLFIPMLGQHGVYTTRVLGTAWYGGVTVFLFGVLAGLLAAILEKLIRR